MKTRLALAAAIALLISAPTFAQITPTAPLCKQGTLASYIALGSAGCMFDSALYRDFTYAAPVSTIIGPAQIIVTPAVLPMANAPFQGLNFSAPWSAAAGLSQVSIIGYNVVPFPPQAEPAPLSAELTLDLGTVTISGIIGSVSVTQQSTPSPAVSTTPSYDLSVFETCEDACVVKLSDSATVTPLVTLQTTLTVTLTGGNAGVALENFAAGEFFGVQPE